MAYEETYTVKETPSNIILENRRRMTVSGVEDMESFDEGLVVVSTGKGTLLVRGAGMHMEKLSLDSGEVIIEGDIDGFEYETDAGPKEGFFAKLFK